MIFFFFFFFSSRRRHTRSKRDRSSDVCSSDLEVAGMHVRLQASRRARTDEESHAEGFHGPDICSVVDEMRSEERRVGKECRYRRKEDYEKKKIIKIG